MSGYPNQVFSVGRAVLSNGPNATPFPSTISQIGNDRIRMSGRYYTNVQVGESEADRAARAQAFVQQWTGLSSEPDAVPLVSEAQPQLTGAYRVLSSSVDWVQTLTTESGYVVYAADLERVRPSSSGALLEVQYASASRSTAEASIVATPVSWIPSLRSYQNVVADELRDGVGEPGPDGSLVFGQDSDGVGSYQYQIASEDFYSGAATIEARYAGSDVWFPVVGTQIPDVGLANLRMTNGSVRVHPFAAGDSQVVVEGYSESLIDFSQAVSMQILRTDTQTLFDVNGQPTIVRNSPESVTIKYPLSAPTQTALSRSMSISLDRGQLFARFSVDDYGRFYFDPDTSFNLQTGYAQSTADNADGVGWGLYSALGVVDTGGVQAGTFGVGDSSPFGAREWGLGATLPVDNNQAAEAQLYWGAVAATQRFVSI